MLGLNHRGQYQFNIKVTCIVFAGVGVALRGLSKLKQRQGFHKDDYWILVALVSYWTAVGFCIWGLIAGGGGMEIGELLEAADRGPKYVAMAEHYLQSLFIGYILCTISLYATKLSILLFYRRIFSIERKYQWATLIVMLFATAWFIAAELTTLLACRPVNAFWDRSIPGGKCYNFSAMYLGTGIVDALIDVVILVLPIRMAFKLRLPIRTKLAVVAILALGGFVVIAQVFRLTYVYNPHGNTLHLAELEKWTNVHESTAIVCACLPLYKPLMVSVSEQFEKITTYLTSISRSTPKNSKIQLNHSSHEYAVRLESLEFKSSSTTVTSVAE